MNTYYSFWFRTILPIGYDTNKEPQSDAERLALETMNSIVRFDPRYPNEGICERYEANLKKLQKWDTHMHGICLVGIFRNSRDPFFTNQAFMMILKNLNIIIKKPFRRAKRQLCTELQICIFSAVNPIRTAKRKTERSKDLNICWRRQEQAF